MVHTLWGNAKEENISRQKLLWLFIVKPLHVEVHHVEQYKSNKD